MTYPNPGIVASDTFVGDRLIAGDFPRVTAQITVASSAALVRGTVLGQITASGKYIKSLSAAVDGSQTPAAVLANDADASGGDVLAGVYLSGEFNGAAMTFGAGHTATTQATVNALRDASIFIKSVNPSTDPT